MRLPEFVRKISPIGETLEAVEAGAALLAKETERRNRQLSVSTADTGLSSWAADYSLPGGGGMDYIRALVWAAMAGDRTLTEEELKAMAVTVGGADGGAVEEDFTGYHVTLYALYEGRAPGDVAALEAALRRRKPAHLMVEVVPVTVLRGTVRRYAGLTGGIYLETRDG